MIARALADVVVSAHLAFVIFVALGGLLVLRRRRVAWVHVPAVLWGAVVEFADCMCPLTPLENRLRAAAGDGGYAGGFIERYMLPVLYPAQLTRTFELVLGVAVLAINSCIYWRVIAGVQDERRTPSRSR